MLADNKDNRCYNFITDRVKIMLPGCSAPDKKTFGAAIAAIMKIKVYAIFTNSNHRLPVLLTKCFCKSQLLWLRSKKELRGGIFYTVLDT